MATPAAILQVAVEANTASATTDLRRFNTQLTQTDKRSITATTRTSALGRASRATGGHLRSAARYAAGAAAAYLSIAQAKAAVTTTQDLAKTTAGLNRNLGLATKEASRWAAVAKSRDVDGKALTMSFTTLSRRLTDTAAALKEGGSAADSAYAPFKRLGLSQAEVVRGSQDLAGFLPKLANAFGEAEGGAKRQASAQQLLGRGYQSILPLFAEGAKGLREQQEWADKYGATLNNKTLKAQMDLVSAQRESKVAWMGLQVTFARAVTPALEKVNRQFQHIAAIMADDRLTNAEKFERIGRIIEKWADKAFDAFVDVLPKIVSEVGARAPRVAEAFVKGFTQAPILGQLALGVWLMGKLGGLGTVGGIGGRIGTRLGTSMGNAAGPIVAGMIISAIEGAKVGKKLAESMTTEIPDVDLFKNALAVGGKQLRAMVRYAHEHEMAFDKGVIREWLKAGEITPEQAGKMVKALKDVNQHAAQVQRMNAQRQGFGFALALARDGKLSKPEINKILNQLEALPKKARDVAANAMILMARNLEAKGELPKGAAKRLTDDLDDKFGKIPKDVKGAMNDAFRYFDGSLGQMVDTGRTKSKNLRDAIAGSVSSAAKAVGKGMAQIVTTTNSALKAFGVKPVALAIAQGVESQKHQRGGIIHAQTGVLVPGYGNGDKVPAMLEPGEVVLNKKAVAAMGGAQRANKINAMIPRFASGGEVKNNGSGSAMAAMMKLANAFERADEPYLLGGGHGGFLTSPAPVDCSGAVSAILHAGGLLNGAPMVSGALMNWGRPGRGDVTVFANPGHTVMEIGGRTVGTSNSNPNGGAGFISAPGESLAPGAIRSMSVSGAVGQLADKVARVMLKGPDGPLREMGQAALDKARRAANKYVSAKMPRGTLGGGDLGTASGMRGSFSKVWDKVNPDLGKWKRLMGEIVQVESSGDPHAGGPGTSNPGHAGWFQYDAPTWAGDRPGGAPGWPEGPYDPGWASGGAGNAIRSDGMAGVIQRWTRWDGVTPQLARGGIVQKLASGGIARNFAALGSRKGKRRHKALGNILAKVKGLGLNEKTFERLHDLTEAAATFDEYASNAASLDSDTGLGLFQGKTQAQWLGGADGTGGEIAKLFELRNTLIVAEEQVEKRMGTIGKWVEQARERFEKIAKFVRDNEKALKANERKQEQVQRDIEQAQKTLDAEKQKPKKKQSAQVIQTQSARIDTLQKQLLGLKQEHGRLSQAGLRGTRERDLLKNRVIPSMTDKQKDLIELRGSILGTGGDGFDGLETVQGLNGPMKVLKNLPPLGTLGGSIFDVQSTLASLGVSANPNDTTTTTTTDNSDLVDLLKSALQTAQQQFAVSQAQYGVFGSTPVLGAFARGGDVGRTGAYLVGEQGPEIVGLAQGSHVYPSDQSASMLSPDIQVHFYEGERRADVFVNGEQQAAQTLVKRGSRGMGRRTLPGARGY